jgi:hypothetical protein
LTDPLTWAAISAPKENTTTKLSTSSPLIPRDNQQKNQTPISISSAEKQQQQQSQPFPPKTNTTTTTAVSNTTAASNNTSNATILKPTTNTGSSGTTAKSTSTPSNSEHPSTEPQNPLLNTNVLVALITTIGGVIGTITAAIIANKNKNKSS